ncbi:hypothetical protein [Aquimarina sp. RZ0]|uniref:hypothetical protein n=1 Tax=Aquimarina sp. RZ0 TaxID=2607730 RepID=UPI0011F17B5A|nr:hypothetical protein [Aquimarina sp. RZ0]KAA1244745.1 hypothetical protein F0000_15335 [Aquimarina sp. RZ0]
MELYNNDFCTMELYDRFVIITNKEGTILTLEKANTIRKKLKNYYGNQSFLMISIRKEANKVLEEVYKQGQLSNMKGIAIVSANNNKERDKAIAEQKLFDKSFVFFDTIDEAKSWAESYF